MKSLYVLCSNNGDGSSSVYATFDKDLIDEMDAKYSDSDSDFDYETWSDGDGFHYDVWTVPDECNAKTMGFSELTRDHALGE